MSKARDLAGIFNLNPTSGTTAQRPATADVGEIYYNGTTGKTQIYTPTGWQDMASGIPYGNTSGRPAAVTGQPYFNGEEKRLELYTSSGWQNIVSETPGVVSVSGNYLESTGSATFDVTGTNFTTGAIASVVGSNGIEINASSTTVNSIVSITAVFSGLSNANEPYDLKITNTSNLFGLLPDAIYINESPIWQTPSGSLGTFIEEVSVNLSAVALDSDSTITYSLASGSALPSGISLNSATGVISGTLPSISSNTTYTFTINASDGANSIVPRTFNIVSEAKITPASIEYLVVAGGGGGFANGWGGGGGAGGMLYGTKTSPNSSLYISVGAGGAQSSRGTDSQFDSIICYGGGTGGTASTAAVAGTYGSGGGGGGDIDTSGSAGTAGQGNAGGRGYDPAPEGAGGGGGAGAVGVNGSASSAGAGGVGLQSAISGVLTYYAGGGAGSLGRPDLGGARASGGLGGGGAGGQGAYGGGAVNGTNGSANTGGGGGAGPVAGIGGSGVVILAYTSNSNYSNPTIPGTLTYTLDTATRAGYKVYKFTEGSGTVTF